MRLIAIHGVRGGTGRTTLAWALASAFAAQQRRVLVLDATRPGHIPDWGRGLGTAASDRLSGRVRLARARSGGEVERAVVLARAAGVEIGVIDTAGLPVRLGDPLTLAALEAAHLIVLPVRTRSDAGWALDEMEALGPRPAVALGIDAPDEAARREQRAAWAAWGGAPSGLLRAGLDHREALALGDPRLPGWLHARHAALLAAKGERHPDPTGASAALATLLARRSSAPRPSVSQPSVSQPLDPTLLDDHADAVRDANAVASELTFRLDGLRLAPEPSRKDETFPSPGPRPNRRGPPPSAPA